MSGINVVKSTQVVAAGGGSDPAAVGGMLHVDLTAVGTTAVTTIETLKTYSLPANTLNEIGKSVLIKAWGTMGANANNKTVLLTFGATAVVSVGPAVFNGSDWSLESEVFLTGVGTQKTIGGPRIDALAINEQLTTPAEDETGDIAVEVRAKNDVATIDDIVCEGITAEFKNAA